MLFFIQIRITTKNWIRKKCAVMPKQRSVTKKRQVRQVEESRSGLGLFESYHEVDQRLLVLLTKAQSVEDLLQAFLAESKGSLHFCGKPLLSEVELYQVAVILASYLRVVCSKGEIVKVSALPLTIKRAAWKRLSPAEKLRLKKILGLVSEGSK